MGPNRHQPLLCSSRNDCAAKIDATLKNKLWCFASLELGAQASLRPAVDASSSATRVLETGPRHLLPNHQSVTRKTKHKEVLTMAMEQPMMKEMKALNWKKR